MSKTSEVNKNIPLTEATPSAVEAADTNHIASLDATLVPSRSVSLMNDVDKHSKALSDATSTHSILELDKGDTPPAASASSNPADTVAIPLSPGRFWLLFISLCICVFLFALDQLILATAIPKITDEFGALDQLPWLANGFFITMLAANLLYSQSLRVFPSKAVIICAVFIFELGSLICGVARNMPILIFGRAVAGLGAAGIFTGAVVILAETTTMQKRAQLMGLIGVAFAIASVVGPLVGGAFADHVTWRWCFYINLPFGGISIASFVFLLPSAPPMGQKDSWKGWGRHMLGDVARFDWIGAVIILAWSTCFILALQWGGASKPWSDGSVIACLVMIPFLLAVFVAWERYVGPGKAMLQLSLFKNPTVVGACLITAFGFAAMMVLIYYMSEDMQALYNLSATDAGIRLLPMIGTQIVTLIVSGRLISRFGKAWYIIVPGPVLIAIGGALLTSVRSPDTSISHLMGYGAIVGVGVGLFLQNTMILVQWDYHTTPKVIPQAMGAVMFWSFVGRILGISLGGVVFSNTLKKNLLHYAPTLGREETEIILSSASGVWTAVPENLRYSVLTAYAHTLSNVYAIAIPCGVIAFASAFLINRNGGGPGTAKKATGQVAVDKNAEKGEKTAVPPVATEV